MTTPARFRYLALLATAFTYIRGAWGNHGSVVTARRANELRAVPLE